MADLRPSRPAPGLRPAADTVELTFEGRRVTARASDTVAGALVAAGEPALRQAADGDRRGIFCGMGVCQECLVTIDGVPGQRACLAPARDGMVITRQPARPELPVDAPTPAPAPAAEREVSADLVVVGGGPAGLAAAAAAARAGLDVVLVDERAKLGGQYYKQPDERLVVDAGALDAQYRGGRELVQQVRDAGVRILGGVEVWGAVDAHQLLARRTDGSEDLVLHARALVLAPGAYERGVPLPGWTLPGVMTTGAAQTLLRAQQVAPGARVLVSGHGPLNMQLAAELVRGGVEVVALAELARIRDPRRAADALRMASAAPDLARDGLRYGWTLRRVPQLTGHAVVRIEGEGRVQRAFVAAIDADGRARPGSERAFAVDAVCVGFGFQPATELSRALGLRHAHDPASGELRVQRDAIGRTSLDGVWVVGDGGGIGGAKLAQVTGTLAGLDAARVLGRPATDPAQGRAAERARARHARFQRALWRLYAAPRIVDQWAQPDTLICRCERVAHRDAVADFDAGMRHIGAVKRVSRAGMGGCQGRYCGPLLAEIAARRDGRPVGEHDLFAPAMPFKPVAIDALAQPQPEPQPR